MCSEDLKGYIFCKGVINIFFLNEALFSQFFFNYCNYNKVPMSTLHRGNSKLLCAAPEFLRVKIVMELHSKTFFFYNACRILYFKCMNSKR